MQQVNTLAALDVPETTEPSVTRSTEEPVSPPSNMSAMPQPEQRGVVRSSLLSGYECDGLLCRSVASELRSKLDFNIDPCIDFYKFVCRKYRGRDAIR
ncbi:hypothetical protein MTO96_023081 [Rhipicephalus appendiculatus]